MRAEGKIQEISRIILSFCCMYSSLFDCFPLGFFLALFFLNLNVLPILVWFDHHEEITGPDPCYWHCWCYLNLVLNKRPTSYIGYCGMLPIMLASIYQFHLFQLPLLSALPVDYDFQQELFICLGVSFVN